MIRLAAVLAVFLALPLTARAELSRYTFSLDGRERQVFFFVPKGARGPMPVVLMLHGGGGTARQMLRVPGRAMNTLAAAEGFITVYPDAVGRSWDFGEDRVSAKRRDGRVDDLAYFRHVIDRIAADPRADASRIFATGISRGGQASFFLACKLPGRIRAIAPVAMSLPDFLADDCRRAPPTPVALIHGTADPLVPYAGGPIRVGRQKRDDVIGAEATVALFAARNRCEGGAVTRRIGAVARTDRTGCRAPVVLYRVEGGGHTWPGAPTILPRRLVGTTNRDIDANREIWRFFSRF